MKKLLTGLFLLGACTWAAAQAWPTAKPIRIVVAYPAGGVSDTVARALADKLAVQLGTPVVIENKAGASGSLGVDAVAKAAPDGYTLGFAAVSPLALNPHLGKSPFDPQKDIAPVVSVMYSPVLLLGRAPRSISPALSGSAGRMAGASPISRPSSLSCPITGLAKARHAPASAARIRR